MTRYFLLFTLIFFGIVSCMTTRKMSQNEKKSGHFRLYSYPEKLDSIKFDKNRYTRIGFAATNDVNGMTQPSSYFIKNRFSEQRELRIGGVAALKTYLDILKQSFSRNLIYLDAGNFLNQETSHLYTAFLYNFLEVDATSFAGNELKIKNSKNMSFPTYIQKIASKYPINLISSNLFDLRTTESINWKGVSPYRIKEIDGVKIGFISIITPETATSVADENINGLYIQNPAKNIILKAKELRKKGIQIVILMSNSGFDCTSKIAHDKKISEVKVNFDTYSSSQCDFHNSPLYKILQKLPPRSIDLIFTSGKKSKVANNILGFPVLQNYGAGKYLSWLEVYFDKKHKAIDRSMTIIHQPILLCHNFLKENQDCFTQEVLDNKELVPAYFLQKKIIIEPLPELIKGK